ncbi:phage late control D family protein [Litoreibacter janthinus]|uniref:Phage protein D n=1 Tax=Litoreibacter janthinus TaxID=670154 RepID=A0A1I6H8G4_9RHOB|nr:hypothetical protein [Litoreibacter janthinus]SFR50732.1 hypothetical protein SAMN04488002_2669 [Litoreibacter janthinus]
MGLLDQLLDPGFRQAASVEILVGAEQADLGSLADLVSSIEVRSARMEAASASITIDDRRDTNGDYMAADSGLFARWAAIVINADFQTHIEEVFRGYIMELKPSYPQNGGEAKLVIECLDDSAALSREHQRRIWGDETAPMTDRAILEELISPLPLTLASGPEGASARALTQDATPIAFLQDRAKANGFEMIFERGEIYFGPKRLESDPQAKIMVYAGSATNCLNFEVSDEANKPDIVAWEKAPATDGAEAVTGEAVADLPLLGRYPAASEGAGLGTPAIARIKGEGDETVDEVTARAQGLVNEASFRIKASGELDGTLYGHVLRVGGTVTVDGVGSRNGGIYYVDTVTHQFSPDGYRQQFQLIRNAVGETEAIGAPPLSSVLSAIQNLF